MKKRNIILLVTGFLLLSILIAKKTQAAELTEPLTFQINDFTYSVIMVATDTSEGSVGIVSYKGTESSLVLPSTVTYEDKVYKVTEITGWGAIYDLSTLEKLTIPASIEFIANNTIIANRNLESIIFLGSVPPTFVKDSIIPSVVMHKAELIIRVPHNSVTLYRNALASKVEYSYSPGTDLYEAGYGYIRVIASDYNDPQPALIVAAPSNITKAFNFDLAKSIYVPTSGLSNYKAAFSKQIKAGTVKVSTTNKIDDILFSMLP